MLKKKPVILLVLSILILFSVIICYTYPSILAFLKTDKAQEKKEVEIIISEVALSHGPLGDNISGKESQTSTAFDLASQLKKNLISQVVLLPVDTIMQLPELPTGCEITSLTIALGYLGFNVDKEYMATYYLEKADPFEGGFNDYFIGSPWNSYSWGCYSPVITNSAARFLADHNSNLHAYNITGSTIEQLCLEIASGNPVIVWAGKYIDKETTTTPILLDDGTTAYWYSNEHCMVLIGYDFEKSTVTLCDPLQGIVEYDFNTFAVRYEEFQRMGVVIK